MKMKFFYWNFHGNCGRGLWWWWSPPWVIDEAAVIRDEYSMMVTLWHSQWGCRKMIVFRQTVVLNIRWGDNDSTRLEGNLVT